MKQISWLSKHGQHFEAPAPEMVRAATTDSDPSLAASRALLAQRSPRQRFGRVLDADELKSHYERFGIGFKPKGREASDREGA